MPLLLSRFSHVRLCCDPIDGSPPGSPIPGILQARVLEWVAIAFSGYPCYISVIHTHMYLRLRHAFLCLTAKYLCENFRNT